MHSCTATSFLTIAVFASCFPGIGRCTSDSASKHFDVSMIATYVHVEGIKLF